MARARLVHAGGAAEGPPCSRWRAPLLALVAALVGSACRATVLSELSEAQANEVVVALDAAHVAARKERDASGASEHAYRVDVPAAEGARAVRALQAARLPRQEAHGLEALERSAGLIATPEEERGALIGAVSGELSRTLARLPGVLEARVHVAPPRPSTALDAPAAAAKASVLLLLAPGATGPSDDSVRQLVAGAIAELRPESVSVVQARLPRADPRPPELVALGPVSVPRHSAGPLRAALAAALVLHLLLASALIAVIAKRRREQLAASGS